MRAMCEPNLEAMPNAIDNVLGKYLVWVCLELLCPNFDIKRGSDFTQELR